MPPELAYEIGREFLEKVPHFRGFQVLMAAHTNEAHMHLHYVVNSVSAHDGHKWQCSPKDLKRMREISDKLCREHRLSVIEKTGKSNQHYEYTSSNSWKRQLATDIADSLKYSRNQDDFIAELTERDLKVKIYQPNYVGYTFVFTVPQGYCGLEKEMKCSAKKLLGYGYFTEENLFRIMEFNDLSGGSMQWTDDLVKSFLEAFDEKEVHISTIGQKYDINWKSLCWQEIQEIIGRLKAMQKANQTANEVKLEQKQNKEKLNLLLTCGEEWLEFYKHWLYSNVPKKRLVEEDSFSFDVSYDDEEWER